jgi:predicted RNA-binding protein
VSYYLNLFSPETYEAFTKSRRDISGFRIRHQNVASRLAVGDKLVCYLTKLSRWVGIFIVESKSFTDSTPIFYPSDDPFVIRFKVKPLAWLSIDKAVPIHDDRVWKTLSFTRGWDMSSSQWTGKLRGSLNQLDDKDGRFLENFIMSQANAGETFEYDEEAYEKLVTHKIHRLDKIISVTVPQEEATSGDESPLLQTEARESIKVQALLASIGAQMGMKIWLPRNNRAAVLSEQADVDASLIDVLPLNYDETTLRTIEQIDVLWLRRRSIVRAFEVEHTTSIYSGILRMADLLALQPNMNIRLHIVAPFERREKVFQELLRPVFSLLDESPLSERCTYLSYDNVREIAAQKHLARMSDAVLDDYAEEAE